MKENINRRGSSDSREKKEQMRVYKELLE